MLQGTMLAFALATLLAACGTTTPMVTDARMGDSLEVAKASQIIDAKGETTAVEGIDGVSASALIERYHKGFEKPTRIDIYNIGVGTGGSTLGTGNSLSP